MLIHSNLKHYYIVGIASCISFFFGGWILNADSDNLGICLKNNSEVHQQAETARKIINSTIGELGKQQFELKQQIQELEKRKELLSAGDSTLKEAQIQTEKISKELRGEGLQ